MVPHRALNHKLDLETKCIELEGPRSDFAENNPASLPRIQKIAWAINLEPMDCAPPEVPQIKFVIYGNKG